MAKHRDRSLARCLQALKSFDMHCGLAGCCVHPKLDRYSICLACKSLNARDKLLRHVLAIDQVNRALITNDAPKDGKCVQILGRALTGRARWLDLQHSVIAAHVARPVDQKVRLEAASS